MDTIKIKVTPQMDGINFAFSPTQEDEVKKEFPGSSPLWKVFVAYDRKASLDPLFMRVSRFIFPAMLGLADERDFLKIKHLDFVESSTYKLIKRVDLA